MPEDRFPTGDRYFIKRGAFAWVEVDFNGWCQAERSAGFHPKGGTGAATAGFGTSGINGERKGRIVNQRSLDYYVEHGYDDEEMLAILPMLDLAPPA